jgi:enoyl-CoA hydratase
VADELIVDYVDRVAVWRLNRPEARNAINGATARAIARAVDDLDERDGLSVAIITGNGNSFCAGMDLKGFLRGDLPSIEGRGFAGLVQRPPRKPLIAAVEGWALAGGCEIAIACDIVVASTEAKFGLPEPKRGMIATGGGTLKLARQLPYHIAMELLLTGEPLAAERAFYYGFVNRLVAPGEALAEALAIAKTIAANGPLAIEAIKQIAIGAADWSSRQALVEQNTLAQPVFSSNDAREGARAFAEKRPPKWTRS